MAEELKAVLSHPDLPKREDQSEFSEVSRSLDSTENPPKSNIPIPASIATGQKETQGHDHHPNSPTEFELYNAGVHEWTLPLLTRGQLSKFNGVDRVHIYVAIKGLVYDVSENQKNYGFGNSYHKLVGKDVSRLLALNRLQLKPDAEAGDLVASTWDTSDLTEKQQKALDGWEMYFRKRYKIVAAVLDHVGQK